MSTYWRGERGRAVDADPLGRQLQVRAGGAAGAPVQRGEQRVDHARHRRLAVGAGDVDRRVGALRRPEQVHQRRDPGERRLDLRFRPTFVEFGLDQREFGQVDRRRGPSTTQPGLLARIGHRDPSAASRAPMPFHLVAGQPLAGADLVHHRRRVPSRGTPRWTACRWCRRVPSRRRRGPSPVGAVSASRSTAPEVSISTVTVPPLRRTSTAAVAAKPSSGGVNCASAGHRGASPARSAPPSPM